jgi:hypothetical protein
MYLQKNRPPKSSDTVNVSQLSWTKLGPIFGALYFCDYIYILVFKHFAGTEMISQVLLKPVFLDKKRLLILLLSYDKLR